METFIIPHFGDSDDDCRPLTSIHVVNVVVFFGLV